MCKNCVAYAFAGQKLIVTTGLGWAQREGWAVEEIRPAMRSGLDPTRSIGMCGTDHGDDAHCDSKEQLNSVAMEWRDHVSDEEYRR